MVTVEEYYQLPYSIHPQGWIELTSTELEALSTKELTALLEKEEYTKRTRFEAALTILVRG